MRVNIYAEEMTDRVEIIAKEIDGHKFTGLRFYLELPASYYTGSPGRANAGEIVPATVDGPNEPLQLQAPFIHRLGDDDSAAVTFWGKRDLRLMLVQALSLLDRHYAERDGTAAPVPAREWELYSCNRHNWLGAGPCPACAAFPPPAADKPK